MLGGNDSSLYLNFTVCNLCRRQYIYQLIFLVTELINVIAYVKNENL